MYYTYGCQSLYLCHSLGEYHFYPISLMLFIYLKKREKERGGGGVAIGGEADRRTMRWIEERGRWRKGEEEEGKEEKMREQT